MEAASRTLSVHPGNSTSAAPAQHAVAATALTQTPAPSQQQQLAPAPTPHTAISFTPAMFTQAGGLEGYDMSSLDQLQAHAVQLSASAGLTNLLSLPNGQMTQQQVTTQQGLQLQSQPQQHQQQQEGGQHQSGKPQQFIFLQTGPNGQGIPTLATLGPAPAVGQANGNPTQSFILTGVNGTNLSQQIFAAAAAGGPATLALAPNGTFHTQQRSYSSSGIPIPIPMIIPQQQQQQVAHVVAAPQFQPLQPAPSAAIPAAPVAPDNGNNKANKRLHDVSASTISLDSGGTLHNGGSGSSGNLLNGTMSMNMNDYPEFQLRNKDGSVITEADLEKMTPAERRRYERNLREQQRSFRISQQIQQLRDVLAESKVPFKPNKYSILVSVADYIKQLQTRAIMLDSEHKKLFKTIQETNEMVASGQIPTDTVGGTENGYEGSAAATNGQGDLLFVPGLDYQAVFEQTPTANGVASIDGRILACNRELENILETPRQQVERQSLFTLVQNHQEIFEAMAELLKRADALSNGSLKADPVQLLYWSGRVVTPSEKKLGMNITLACTKDGSPKFFSFCMSPV